MLIVVVSAHRAAAFDACRWLIDTLKRTVPIWKKEYFEDGAVWADGEPFPSEVLAEILPAEAAPTRSPHLSEGRASTWRTITMGSEGLRDGTAIRLLWRGRRLHQGIIPTLDEKTRRESAASGPAAPELQRLGAAAISTSQFVSSPSSSPAESQSEPATTLRVDVNLVNVFVTVTDAQGAPVAGLTKDNFVLMEDGHQQKIAVFNKESALPLSIALAIDTSLSTRHDLPLEEFREALRARDSAPHRRLFGL